MTTKKQLLEQIGGMYNKKGLQQILVYKAAGGKLEWGEPHAQPPAPPLQPPAQPLQPPAPPPALPEHPINFKSLSSLPMPGRADLSVNKQCSIGRLRQFIGTCWLNTMFNMFILSDTLLAIVLVRLYETYNDSNPDSESLEIGVKIPYYSKLFKSFSGICPDLSFLTDHRFDISEYLFALVHGIFIDNIKIHPLINDMAIVGLHPILRAKTDSMPMKEVLKLASRMNPPSTETYLNLLKQYNPKFISDKVYVFESIQNILNALYIEYELITNIEKSPTKDVLLVKYYENRAIKLRNYDGYTLVSATIIIKNTTNPDISHICVVYKCGINHWVYDSVALNPVRINIREPLIQEDTMKMYFHCGLYIRTDIDTTVSQHIFKYKQHMYHIRNTRFKPLPKYITQIFQDIEPKLLELGLILYSAEESGSFQLSENLLKTYDNIIIILEEILDVKQETTMNKKCTTVKAIKEQLISYLNTIKQELVRVDISHRCVDEIIGILTGDAHGGSKKHKRKAVV
jgi:hypothetical protein